ncbi:MAG: hypothetical protein KC613_20235, partial [Myxococcales bacterium]|nr:hypothetical protein [Myxococcales bacterium]
RFTFVALDTDRPEHAGVIARYPPQVWPTFYVIDPVTGDVRGRWLGAASKAQFLAFLGEAQAAAGPDDPAGLARRADQKAAEGRLAEAESLYARALAAGPAAWTRRPDLRTAQITLRHKLGDHAECAELAAQALPEALAGATPSAADFVYYLHACVTALPRSPERAALLGHAAAGLEGVLAAEPSTLSVDDRSELLRVVRQLHLALGDEAAARSAAERQAALLAQAWGTGDAQTRMGHAWPRCEVHSHLGTLAALEPDLVALTEALPDAYDPAYRLAWARRGLGQLRDALAPAERAVSLAYGPRRARARQLLADIQEGLGELAASRRTWQAVLTDLEALPARERPPGAEEAARKALGRWR